MRDVANIRIVPTPNVIHHEGASRSIDISAGVEGRDLGAVAGDVKEQLANITFPLGYHAELLGEYKERQDAQNDMILYGIAAAIGIFLLLQASFRSWRLAILSFVTLPMALVGGLLAVVIGADGILSIGSLVGFFTVFGIAARNGILMINHFQHLERYEGETFGPQLVMRGALERLSPILMTTLATGLALVPLVIAGNSPGHEIEHPLAVVIVGGLITSTLLNLFVVPVLYLRFARGSTQPSGDHRPCRVRSAGDCSPLRRSCSRSRSRGRPGSRRRRLRRGALHPPDGHRQPLAIPAAGHAVRLPRNDDRGQRARRASTRVDRHRSDQGDRRRPHGRRVGPGLQRGRAGRGRDRVLRAGRRGQRLGARRAPGGVRERQDRGIADLDPRHRSRAGPGSR